MAVGNGSSVSNDNAADDGLNNTPPPGDMPANDAMPPPPQAVEPRLVELHFNGNQGEGVTFKLKNTTKLRKAMDAYSARVQRPVDQLRFLFEGSRLGGEDTPESHEMEDGDIVEVHMEQIGGGLSREEIEDWVEIESTKTQLKNVTEEKARLMATTNRLRLELTALKINNRALARENNSLKIAAQRSEAKAAEADRIKTEGILDKTEAARVKAEADRVLTDAVRAQAEADRIKTQADRIIAQAESLYDTFAEHNELFKKLDAEKDALTATLKMKDVAIDAILKDFASCGFGLS